MNDTLDAMEMIKFLQDGDDSDEFVESLRLFLLNRGFLSYKQMAILAAKAERKLLIVKIREHYGVKPEKKEKKPKYQEPYIGDKAWSDKYDREHKLDIIRECQQDEPLWYPDKDY
jgi:hypothetical protein